MQCSMLHIGPGTCTREMFTQPLNLASEMNTSYVTKCTSTVKYSVSHRLYSSMHAVQAYGAKNYKLVGLVYQRALLIVTLSAVPLVIILMFARPLLMLGGQTDTVATMTAAYIRSAFITALSADFIQHKAICGF